MSEASVGRVDLDLGINYGAFNKELSGISNHATEAVGGAFKKLGLTIAAAFAVDKLVDFGRNAIELASDLNEVQNVVDVTFGSMATDINEWSKAALQGFGLSELSAKRYASTLGAMMKSSGLAGSQMEMMSKRLTELSADMASFYNLSNNEAFEKIRSGIAGETDPLMSLGINMSVANLQAYALTQGITKQWQAMSQAEQVLLRYNYLLSVSSDAQGDFARTSGGWANQTRLLTEQWKIFQGTMGQGFINVLAPVLKWLNVLIAKLQVAAQYFKAFTEVIFGAQNATSSASSSASAAAASMGSVGDATTGAAKDVKKAGKAIKGSLSGFDQLNTLAKSTASSMGDISDTAATAAGGMDLGSINPKVTPDIQTDAIKAKVQKFTDWLKTEFGGVTGVIAGIGTTLATAFGPALAEAWNQISPVLSQWETAFQVTFTDILSLGEPLKNWLVNDVVPLWQQGVSTLGHVLAGLLDSALKVFNSLRDAAMPVLESFVSVGLPLLTDFATGALRILQSLFDLVKTIFDDLWGGAVSPGLMLISTMIVDTLDILRGFWDKWGVKIVDNLKQTIAGVKQLWQNLWDKFLEPFVTNMLEMLTWLWEKHLKGLVAEIADFVGKLVTAAQDIYNECILPIVNYLVKTLGPTFSNIFSFIGDVVGTAIATIADVLKGLIKALGGLVDFIAGVFTGDWKRAWNGIKTFTEGIGDAIVGVFKGAVNLIIDAFNFMIRQINGINIDIPDWVPGMGGKSLGFSIPTIPKLAKGGLAYGPTLAMVGDNKGASADPEVISPLSKLQEMLGGNNDGVVAALQSVIALLEKILAKDSSITIGETEFGRVAAKSINSAQRQARRTLLEV